MKLKTYVLIAALFAVLFFASIYFTAQYGRDITKQQEAAADAATTTAVNNALSLHVVTITADGFNPAAVTVNSGDAVRFVNMDSVPHWPASAQHPTHTVYPESGGCIGSTFDSCTGLEEGESWSFVFGMKGEWKYHDHLNCCADSRFFGTVVVT